MQIIRYLFLSGLILLYNLDVCKSQNKLLELIPPSPEASAFKVLGDYPVSHYTGLIDISIPLYTVEVDNVNIPISLNYHSSGIRVDQASSWVGLGWTLSPGGIITRSIRGIPDEDPNGILDQTKGYNIYPNTIPNINYMENNASNAPETQYLLSVKDGLKDSESDLYTLSINNINTKFIFDENGVIHCFPNNNIKITRITGGWKVVDDQGVNYIFTHTEITSQINRKEKGSPQSFDAGLGKTTGWYLSKIITSKGRIIEFLYQQDHSAPTVQLSESLYAPAINLSCQPSTYISSSTELEINYSIPLLSRINFPQGQVNFNLNNALREDAPQAHYLDNLEVKNSTGLIIKKYSLIYSYFQSPNNGYSTQYDKRLKLEQLIEIDRNGNTIPPYIFNYYNDIPLPNRASKDMDHWGYYNGQNMNDYRDFKLIPEVNYIKKSNSVSYTSYSGANRNPRFPEMRGWCLSSITYPTGGMSEFEYEPHNYYIPFNSPENTSISTSTSNYSNESVTASNEFFRNVICTHEIIVPGINGKSAKGKFTLNFAAPTAGHDDHIVYLREKGSTNNIYVENYSGPATQILKELQLISGKTYELIMQSNLSMPDNITVNLEYEIINNSNTDGSNAIAGGLRIKRVINRESSTSIPSFTEYRYCQSGKPTLSSANFNHDLLYFLKVVSDVKLYIYCPNGPAFDCQSPNPLTIILGGNGLAQPLQWASEVFYSSSQNGLGQTHGASVGYARVEERQGFIQGNTYVYGNGYSEYLFTTPNKDSSIIKPEILNGFVNLRPDGISYYKAIQKWKPDNFYPLFEKLGKDWEEGLLISKKTFDANENLVDSIKNFYSFDINRKKISEGLKIVQCPYVHNCGADEITFTNYPNNAIYQRYSVYSSRTRLDKKIETHKFSNGELETSEEYTYNEDYLKLKTITTKKSNGNILVTEHFYPFDYNDQISTEMKKANFLLNLKTINIQDNTTLSGQNYNYIEGNLRPEGAENQFLINSLQEWTKDKWDEKVLIDNYDNMGNPLQYHKANDLKVSLIWGYNQTYPVAKFDNYPYSILLSNSVLMNYLNQLETYTDLTNSSVKTSLKALNKSIRDNIPTGVLVTTYTYQPLIGMTSQTDPNGITTFYEYDGFGRLKCIRDDDENILKTFEYNYKH